MTTIRVILIDQLSETISSLRNTDKNHDVIVMCEDSDELNYIQHHPKKIAFQIASMRHFRNKLEAEKYTVRYFQKTTLEDALITTAGEVKATKVIITEASDYRTHNRILNISKLLDIEFNILEDDRFLCSKEEFMRWAKGRKELRMEFFYREMRKKYKILLEKDGSPVGGSWNYDKENRDALKGNIISPKRISHKKDIITEEVLGFVNENFSKNFGDLYPFHFAVTREQALLEAKQFMQDILPLFGKYQDIMVTGEAYLYHSLLSCYLNVGLLLPIELCKMAEDEYLKGAAPLNSVEGFIRQILGWREYIRGIYWNFMPEYKNMKYLDAKNPLPEFFWGKPTKMNCMAEVISQTKQHSYSHHIQRLMVTGNFCLLAGIEPVEVHKWYLEVYADAYEWVELPNTLGMALFGDGGIVASKPYAASGKYINKMSNFCKKCQYDPEKLLGDDACPFNALYWNFFIKHQDKFKNNRRLAYVLATLKRFSEEKKRAIEEQAAKYLKI